MKQIGYRMPATQDLIVRDLSENICCKRSELLRAALHIGLNEIKMMAARDRIKAQELVAINALRAK